MGERQMAFLLATWEGGGSVTPALTVARKLVERGHAVRVMSDEANRFEAEATGARFIAWTRAPSRPNRNRDTAIWRDWEMPSPQEGLLLTIRHLMVGPALEYASDLMDELRREPADLVVSSEMLFGVALGCEALDQPLALLTANISFFPLPGVPPCGAGLMPAQSAEEEQLHADIGAGLSSMLDTELDALNAARRELGLQPLTNVLAQMKVARRTLLGTARAFDFAPATLPANVSYVGPQIDMPAWTHPAGSFGLSEEWPEVLVAFSTTFQGHIATLQRVIDALHHLGKTAIVTLGDTIAPSELRTHEGVRLVHSAPHDDLMRHARLVVTHGGHGTVIRALAHDLPMLLLPHGRDQDDNAVRVTARGAGMKLAAGASVPQLFEAISHLLDEACFAAAARELGAKIRQEIAQSPVVSQIEELAIAPFDLLNK